MLFIPLGETVALPLLVLDGNDAPVDADAAPSANVYSASDRSSIQTSLTAVKDGDISSIDGVYALAIEATAGNGYAAGYTYFAVVTWQVSEADRGAVIPFTVV